MISVQQTVRILRYKCSLKKNDNLLNLNKFKKLHNFLKTLYKFFLPWKYKSQNWTKKCTKDIQDYQNSDLLSFLMFTFNIKSNKKKNNPKICEGFSRKIHQWRSSVVISYLLSATWKLMQYFTLYMPILISFNRKCNIISWTNNSIINWYNLFPSTRQRECSSNCWRLLASDP